MRTLWPGCKYSCWVRLSEISLVFSAHTLPIELWFTSPGSPEVQLYLHMRVRFFVLCFLPKKINRRPGLSDEEILLMLDLDPPPHVDIGDEFTQKKRTGGDTRYLFRSYIRNRQPFTAGSPIDVQLVVNSENRRGNPRPVALHSLDYSRQVPSQWG